MITGMDNFDTYAGRLCWELKHAEMNQSQLAKLLGINPQAIQYLCNKENNAKGSIYNYRMAFILGVSPIWLEAKIGDPIPHEKLKAVENELKTTKETLEKTLDVVKSWGIDDINSVDVETSDIFQTVTKLEDNNKKQVKKIVKTFTVKPEKRKKEN